MHLLIKLLANGIVAVPGLLWSGTTLTYAVLASLLLALFSYVLGDLVILPRTTNTFATVSDFILSFALLWLGSTIFYQSYRLSGLFFTAFAIAVVEFFYHGYLERLALDQTRHPG